MHGVSFQQPLGGASNFLSPTPGHCRGGDLHDATLIHPLQNPLLRLLQNGIALGMSDHRNDADVRHLGEVVVDLRGDAVVAQLHQQVVGIFDGEASWRNQNFPQVIVRKMKIAAQDQLWSLARQYP